MSIIFAFENQINVSLQKRDQVYYSNTLSSGGYQVSPITTLVGEVEEIYRHYDVKNKQLKYVADGSNQEFSIIFDTYDSEYVPTSSRELLVSVNGVVTSNFQMTLSESIFMNTLLNNGDVVEIKLLYHIKVDDSSFVNPQGNALDVNSFITFLKDAKVNKKSVKGYYAEVKFVNNSNEKAELFSIGSEISESSK